jgi:hypothetical protein
LGSTVSCAFFNPADQLGSGGSEADDGPASPAQLDYSTIALCDAPSAELLQQLTAYWRGKCAGNRLPSRPMIDPAEIRRHLPWIFMADVVEGGADYRYRLLGTNIVSANYRDATGSVFSALYADAVKLAGARLGFDRTLATGRPAFTRGRAFWRPDWAFDHFESVFLPLSSDGKTIDIILGEIAYLTPV